MLVVGGGKVGSYLARELDRRGNIVAVHEEDHDRANQVIEESKAIVFQGDGTDIELLRAADVHRADWVLAVTGRDEDNLVAAQLALTLGAQRVLARLNNPRNRPTFEALQIPVVAVTDMMVNTIFREVEVTDLERVDVVGGGEISLVELIVPNGFSETRVMDLPLPQPAILVTVVRGDEVTIPHGDSRIAPGDRVLAATKTGTEGSLRAVFDRGGGTS